MFRWLKVRRFNRIQKALGWIWEVNDDNWPKVKALIIESLLLACEIDIRCSRTIAYWNALASLRRNWDAVTEKVPVAYHTDLFVTLRDLSYVHNRALHDRIEALKK